jgi:hypothetical protein
MTVPGKFFFLFFNIFKKFQLECSHTTKMSICFKFHEYRTESKVVGSNGLILFVGRIPVYPFHVYIR